MLQKTVMLYEEEQILDYQSVLLAQDIYCCFSVLKSCFNFATSWECSTSGLTISWSLFKLMSVELVMPSNHLILCHPLLLLPSIFPSIRVFYNDSAFCIQCPKYCSFSVSISPSNIHPGLISLGLNGLTSFLSRGLSKSLL